MEHLKEREPPKKIPSRPAPSPAQPLKIRLVCPECDAALTVINPQTGQKVKCPKCGAVIPVPRSAVGKGGEEIEEEPEEQPRAKKKPGNQRRE